MAYQKVSINHREQLFDNGNFTYLDELIHSSEIRVRLISDIILGDDEAEDYKEGIKFKGDSLLLDGRGHTIDAKGKSTIFDFNAKKVRIINTTFKNGFEAIFNEGSLTFENCRFLKNDGSITNDGDLVIRDCEFIKNYESEDGICGGGIFHCGGSMEIYDCLFHENSATIGAAIFSNAKAIIKGSTFSENFAARSGAIYTDGNFLIKGCDFIKNRSIDDAGAINNWNASMIIEDSNFLNNYTKRSGDAILNEGNLTVKKSSFKDNRGQYYGCAIYNDDGSLEISDSNFSDNIKAISISRKDPLKLENCEFNDDEIEYRNY